MLAVVFQLLADCVARSLMTEDLLRFEVQIFVNYPFVRPLSQHPFFLRIYTPNYDTYTSNLNAEENTPTKTSSYYSVEYSLHSLAFQHFIRCIRFPRFRDVAATVLLRKLRFKFEL